MPGRVQRPAATGCAASLPGCSCFHRTAAASTSQCRCGLPPDRLMSPWSAAGSGGSFRQRRRREWGSCAPGRGPARSWRGDGGGAGLPLLRRPPGPQAVPPRRLHRLQRLPRLRVPAAGGRAGGRPGPRRRRRLAPVCFRRPPPPSPRPAASALHPLASIRGSGAAGTAARWPCFFLGRSVHFEQWAATRCRQPSNAASICGRERF